MRGNELLLARNESEAKTRAPLYLTGIARQIMTLSSDTLVAARADADGTMHCPVARAVLACPPRAASSL